VKLIDSPSDNYWTDSRPIKAIVMHGTDGPWPAALAWLKNPRADNPGKAVSANYLITKQGFIYRLVDWTKGRRAWANGIVEAPDNSLQWLKEAVKEKVNPNLITVSIEHEASGYEMVHMTPMTNEQFNASIELSALILRTAGLKASHETIVGHNQISGRQKYYCPGVIFPPAYTEVLIIRNPDLKP
jgi:N-acetyl-anhydromuramyl-L-alanine amidase AmpD